VPCWAVKPQQLPQWIQRRLASKGLRADQACTRFLSERLEGNLLAAAQEIERLSLLYPSGHQLQLDELKSAIEDNARFDAFRLTELVMLGHTGRALRSIRVLKDADTPPPMIVSALSRELQTLAAFVMLAKVSGSTNPWSEGRRFTSRSSPGSFRRW